MTEMLFRRGAPITIDLVVNDAGGLNLAALGIEMKLKKATAARVAPSSDTAAVAVFSVAYVAASGSDAAYWRGTISDTASGQLAPGFYIADAKISNGGTVVAVTEPIVIRLEQTVTP